MYQHKENRGTLFVNDPKQKPTDPDLGGSVNFGGVNVRLSASRDARGNLVLSGEGIEGLLYDNSGRKKGATSPDYSGPVTFNGTKKRLAGWNGATKAGAKTLRVSVGEFTEKPAAEATATA